MGFTIILFKGSTQLYSKGACSISRARPGKSDMQVVRAYSHLGVSKCKAIESISTNVGFTIVSLKGNTQLYSKGVRN